MFTRNNKTLLNMCILLLRCTIGIILFISGAGKLFGWFGGFGMHTTIKYFSQSGFSVPLIYISCITECFGGLFLTFGLFTRLVSVAVIINMIVATITMLPHGFLGPNGASYPFIFFVIAIVILLSGPMDYSLDTLIFQHQKETILNN